ncbi:carbohydrate ABC transporter permease [Thermoanaerobacterium sp. RBIITD]|uniref:carbohydrate ABC transporter permease n=1 Tax=Thermoanaerobacterium sp. RBIITD TaxID=1550240 RepID=UPI000BB67F3C|nr:carbohydrate ABC transporter permease [Thermoanaerobacterium sp. RBIITD]SNX53399.1 putative aldouronate transport system permease protein [Thermoanaerobacterium sp. RBIITD]
MFAKKGLSSHLFDIFNYAFLGLIAITTLVPFIYVLAASFSTDAEIAVRSFYLIPHKFTLDAYKYVFSSSVVIRSLFNSVYITIIGTLINLFFTFTLAYFLSKNVIGKNVIINGIIFCMIFSGGMIPTYLLVKSLGMLNTYWALWLPGAISPFNLFIVVNYFKQFPTELEEAAKIDGCNDLQILGRIVLPLSKPILATFALFYGVGNWNAFFNALLYLNDSNKWPIQVTLQNIVMNSSGIMSNYQSLTDPNYVPPAASMRMAVIIIATVPIMLVYPFLQKYFVKGIMIGSLKG